MIDPNTPLDAEKDSAVASDASIAPAPIPNDAAAADLKAAPPVPINPDDLHDLFAGAPSLEGADEEDPLAQLRNDPNYAALIKELEYIATQARLLFEPAQEAPSDDLWAKIQSKLPTEPEAE
jgi:hypothetical protein